MHWSEFVIIVSPRQISDDTAKTGVVKLIRHTRIRRDTEVFVSRYKTGRYLIHLSALIIQTRADPDNITFTGLDSEEVV